MKIRWIVWGLTLAGMLPAEDGFHPVLGGTPYDSGLALGVEYRKERLAKGMVDVRAKGVGSWKLYELAEASIGLPRLAGGMLFAEVLGRYRNYPEEDFWGLGHKSGRERRTTYRVEDAGGTGIFGVRPRKWLEAGASVGWLAVNAGPGKDDNWPSIEERFLPPEVPALDQQADYRLAGGFVRADYRDEKVDTKRGGFYEFRFTKYSDRELHRYSFQRFETDVRQFFSITQRQDTIALRAAAVFTTARAGQQVPFFLQPTVGGGGDLRGYKQYRFRDENALALNAEYRWRIWSIVQLVGFADAARVFPEPGRITVSGMRGSVGIGGRIKLGEGMVLGVDLGWSPDGARVWFRGSQSY